MGAYCLICGAGPFMRVGSHTVQAHGLPSREYRRRFPGADMTDPDTHDAWYLELTERGRDGKPRQRYCKRGHPLRAGNLIYRRDGRRRCKACHSIHMAEWYVRRGKALRHGDVTPIHPSRNPSGRPKK